MFEELLHNLKTLGRHRVVIKADGEYPTKKRTPVQHVAKYQNDGTDRGVTPSRFVERAEDRHGAWASECESAVGEFLGDGHWYPIEQFGMKVAYDIAAAVDRIKTGLLKKSFRSSIERK